MLGGWSASAFFHFQDWLGSNLEKGDTFPFDNQKYRITKQAKANRAIAEEEHQKRQAERGRQQNERDGVLEGGDYESGDEKMEVNNAETG